MDKQKILTKKDISISNIKVGTQIKEKYIASMLVDFAYFYINDLVMGEAMSCFNANRYKTLMEGYKFKKQIISICKILTNAELEKVKYFVKDQETENNKILEEYSKKYKVLKGLEKVKEINANNLVIETIKKEQDLRTKNAVQEI